MITISFDSKRSELQEFIRICDIAYRFAANHQKEPVLGFILSNITGHASAQIQDKIVHNWHELKEILQQPFSEKKTESQLMEELNTLRQNRDEKIMSFYNRVQSLLTRILNTFSQMNPTERRYRSDMIRDIALNRFTLHTKEEISHILRIRIPNNLSDALDFALNEERIINERKQFNSKSINSSNKYCSNCHKKGHTVNECYKKHPNRNQVRDYTENSRKIHVNQPTNGNTNVSNRQNKFCTYCKNPAHLIDECRKREYNN
ncbi:hypothetical protein BDFB_013542 [Asbolus verrucosus]|uniref:CCHC-type domain-containing protein n=1 Tax=Asbolus verrucosus TaxID=1661398 RepID=A0A482VMB2_ASBVE|nr:hypothetical protein BDFB_013542 [Asbolus verrucosus]